VARPRAGVESELAVLFRWFPYIEEARTAYLRAFVGFPAEQLVEDCGASFPSILDIFPHALLADQNWVLYAYHDGDEPPFKTTGWTLAEVEALAGRLSEILDHFLTSLTIAALDREFTFHWTPGDERTRVTMKVRDFFWHLVERSSNIGGRSTRSSGRKTGPFRSSPGMTGSAVTTDQGAYPPWTYPAFFPTPSSRSSEEGPVSLDAQRAIECRPRRGSLSRLTRGSYRRPRPLRRR
jgi:uncharacterized damage-inducible protein DinB